MRGFKNVPWVIIVLAALVAGSTMVSYARIEARQTSGSEIYRQLDLFGEVLHRVRSDYVEKPNDQADRDRNKRHAVGTRSSLRISESKAVSRTAGPNDWRVRWAWARSDDGGRRNQGCHADRRHACSKGRHSIWRLYHRNR